MKPVTIELADEAALKLSRLAEESEMELPDLIKQMIEQRLDYEAWLVAAALECEADADAGPLIPHEDVMAEIDARMLTREATGRARYDLSP